MRRELCALQTLTPWHLRLVSWHITTVLSVMTLAGWVLRSKLLLELNYFTLPFLSPVRLSIWWPSAGKWIFKMLPRVSRVCFPRLKICLWPWILGFYKWGGETESRTCLGMRHGVDTGLCCVRLLKCIDNLGFELGCITGGHHRSSRTFTIVPSTAILLEYKMVISGWNTWRLNHIWFNQPNAICSGLTKVWICIASNKWNI